MNKFRKKLYNYIKENLDAGYSRDILKETLLKKGYDQNVLNEIFNEIDLDGDKGFFGFKKKIRFEFKKDIQPEYQENVITETETKKGLSEQVNDINAKLDMMTKVNLEKKNKNFELPRKITGQLKKLAEKSKVLVILLKTNKMIQPIITDVKDGFISINGTPHMCSMDFIYLWKGKFPCIVLNEWDLTPIGTNDYYKAVEEKRTADPVAVVMRMMKNKEDLMKNKMQFSKGWIIFIVIAIIAAAYML